MYFKGGRTHLRNVTFLIFLTFFAFRYQWSEVFAVFQGAWKSSCVALNDI